MLYLPVHLFVLFYSPEAQNFLFPYYYCTESALGTLVENAALSCLLRVNFVCGWLCDAKCSKKKMNVLLIWSCCVQKSKVKQRLYVLGVQIIFIAFHLKLFVSFDKDYLYLMNGLCFSLYFLKTSTGRSTVEYPEFLIYLYINQCGPLYHLQTTTVRYVWKLRGQMSP